MATRAVSSFIYVTAMFLSHYDMVSIIIIKYFPEATYKSAGSVSGVYQALLFGLKLSSMGMVGRFKYVIPQSNVLSLYYFNDIFLYLL